jgi:hypothetical protein
MAELASMFMPVQVTTDVRPWVQDTNAASNAPKVAGRATSGSRIEIFLPDGIVIRLGENVGLSVLHRVLSVLRR